MTHELWRSRWAEGRIGFHEGRTNAFLAKFIDRFKGRERILVPLCGKADDMAFLILAGRCRLRVAEACRLLRSSNETVERIAGMVGYAETAYFANMFRDEMGVSPGAYRRRADV